MDPGDTQGFGSVKVTYTDLVATLGAGSRTTTYMAKRGHFHGMTLVLALDGHVSRDDVCGPRAAPMAIIPETSPEVQCT